MAYSKAELGAEFWMLTKGILQDSTVDTDEAAVIKPGLMIPYLTSPLGIASVLVMCALIFVGWMMIRKIIKIDV